MRIYDLLQSINVTELRSKLPGNRLIHREMRVIAIVFVSETERSAGQERECRVVM